MSVPSSLESFAKATFATTAGLSTLGFGLLYYGQGYLIYPSAFPPGSRTDVPTPEQFGLPYEDLILETPDNVTLKCFLMKQRRDVSGIRHAAYVNTDRFESDDEFVASRPTVLMFHGNAGNHGHRIPLAKVFYVKMRCNVVMACYRGYGLSTGSPSEKGLMIDSQTILDYITAHPYLSKTPLVIYGQSIGGAVGIDLTSRNPTKITALVLENTFMSIPRLIPHTLPFLSPFSFLCHQKWDSLSKIPLIPPHMPILMLSGIKDEVVPKEHMQGLWEAVVKRGARMKEGLGSRLAALSSGARQKEEEPTGGAVYDESTIERAKYVEFENGTHNDTCAQPGYWTAVADFVAGLRNIFEPEKDRS